MKRRLLDTLLRLHHLRTAYCIKISYGHVCGVPFLIVRCAFRNFDARNPFARVWALGDVEHRANR